MCFPFLFTVMVLLLASPIVIALFRTKLYTSNCCLYRVSGFAESRKTKDLGNKESKATSAGLRQYRNQLTYLLIPIG
jgi:hypothetical protein